LRNAVFIDRDGIINKVFIRNGLPYPPKNIEELTILDGVTEAIKKLKLNDILPIVVTNQPDVSRGIIKKSEVENINKLISNLTGIEFFFTCFHDESDNCPCRKPKPGLLRAADQLNIDLNKSFMVGDRWKDIEAGQAAGCTNFYLDNSYLEKKPNLPFVRVSSLYEAVKEILRGMNS
jgi:D-glycero-D-manno-heptose 1,7-bisphosphate phosphatase